MTAGSSGVASSSGSSPASGLGALVGLMRPLNGVMAAAAVLVGAFVSRSPTMWGPAVLGAFSAFAAAAAANAPASANVRIGLVMVVSIRRGPRHRQPAR